MKRPNCVHWNRVPVNKVFIALALKNVNRLFWFKTTIFTTKVYIRQLTSQLVEVSLEGIL